MIDLNDSQLDEHGQIVPLLTNQTFKEQIEKYDDQGLSTYYKYGSSNSLDNDFFPWSTTSKNYSSFVTRLILSVLCIFLLFFSTITLTICCCMRQNYKKKPKLKKL